MLSVNVACGLSALVHSVRFIFSRMSMGFINVSELAMFTLLVMHTSILIGLKHSQSVSD